MVGGRRTRTWSGEADGGRGGRLGGDDDEAVLLRLPGREEVLERPLQRVEAVLALVHPRHHRHLPQRRRRWCWRRGRRLLRHVPLCSLSGSRVSAS
jgi:hypothetical protein